MEITQICSIGSTQNTANHLFGRFSDAGVKHLLDVLLNNLSQLADFAKCPDLAHSGVSGPVSAATVKPKPTSA